MYNDHLKNSKWLDNVKSIFDECGLSFIWRAQRVYGSKELLCNIIEMSLKDQFKQKWPSVVTESPNYLKLTIHMNTSLIYYPQFICKK